MNETQIRVATPDDFEPLLRFARHQFIVTYAAQNTPENLATYLANTFTEAPFREKFEHPETLILIAIHGGSIVGYAKVNFGNAQTETDYPESGELERLYVHAQLKGLGLGKRLFEVACEQARDRGATYLWLGVWEHNVAARMFYEKLGLERMGTHTFVLGDDRQTDWVMRYELCHVTST